MSKFPPNISLDELLHSQTATRHSIDNTPTEKHVSNLVRIAWFCQTLRDKLREHFSSEAVVVITSGYRVKKLNRMIGGSRTSAHKEGLAADIVVPNMSAYDLAVFIQERMVETGWDQLIHEFGEWVHIGLSESKERQQVLSAVKRKRKVLPGYKTVYLQGIHHA